MISNKILISTHKKHSSEISTKPLYIENGQAGYATSRKKVSTMYIVTCRYTFNKQASLPQNKYLVPFKSVFFLGGGRGIDQQTLMNDHFH